MISITFFCKSKNHNLLFYAYSVWIAGHFWQHVISVERYEMRERCGETWSALVILNNDGLRVSGYI